MTRREKNLLLKENICIKGDGTKDYTKKIIDFLIKLGGNYIEFNLDKKNTYYFYINCNENISRNKEIPFIINKLDGVCLFEKNNITNKCNKYIEYYLVTEKDLIGNLKDHSIDFAQRLIFNQFMQGNHVDIKIFQKSIYSRFDDGGFDWAQSDFIILDYYSRVNSKLLKQNKHITNNIIEYNKYKD